MHGPAHQCYRVMRYKALPPQDNVLISVQTFHAAMKTRNVSDGVTCCLWEKPSYRLALSITAVILEFFIYQ